MGGIRSTKAAVLAAVILALPRFGAAAEVTVSFLTHWPPETVAQLKAAADRYQEDHPSVSVEIRAVPFGDLLTTLRSQAGRENGPTIAGIYDLWLPELARDGIVAEMPVAQAADVVANWPQAVAGAASVGSKPYGYPNEIDLYALIYNKRLFAEAGITAPPKTWDELLAAADKLTVRDGGRITRQGFGLINSWAAGVVHPFGSLLASNGGALIAEGKPMLDSEAARQSFELIQTLIDRKLSDPTMATADANTTGPYLDNFVSGNTAMIIMANWWESALRAGMGDRFADIATAPIPVGPKGDGPHPVSYSWLTVVNAAAGEAERAAAWDFLAWLNGPQSGEGGASAMGGLLLAMGILPSRSSDIAAFADRLNTPFLKGYVDQLPAARPFPVVLGGQEFTEALQQHLEAVQYGQATAAEAEAAAQTDAAAILERAAQ